MLLKLYLLLSTVPLRVTTLEKLVPKRVAFWDKNIKCQKYYSPL